MDQSPFTNQSNMYHELHHLTHVHTKMLLLVCMLLQNSSASDRRQEGIIHMQLALLVFPAGNVTQLSPILALLILSPAILGL